MSRFLSSVTTLSLGTIAAQIVTVVGVLATTRLVSPAEFGAFGIQVAVSAPIAILASGRYEAAFIRSGTNTAVANLLLLSGGLIILVSLGAVVAIGALEALTGISIGAALTGGLVLSQSVFACVTQLNNFNRSYTLIAASRIIASIVNQSVTLFLAAILGMGSAALSIGMVAGLLSASVVALVGNREWVASVRKRTSRRRIKAVARRHVSYLTYTGPQAVASGLQESAAIWVVSVWFGQAATGLYVLMGRLLKAPISVLAESIGRVLQRHMRDLGGKDDRLRFLSNAIALLCVAALLFWFLVLALATFAIDFALGAEWSDVAALARSSAGYFAAYLVGASIAAVPLALGTHRKTARVAIIGSVLYPISLLASTVAYGDLADAFQIVSLVMIVYFSVFSFAVYRSVLKADEA